MIKDWASQKLFGHPKGYDEKAVAIGAYLDNDLIAAVVYTDYHKDRSIEMSIVSIDSRWATRHNLKRFFAYPFIQLKLKRVQAVVSVHNEGAISMLERLGFKREGTHRCAYWDGKDAHSYGMLKHECRYI